MAATSAVTARPLIVDPIPAGIRDLPARGLAGATTILGPPGGRATTTSILQATRGRAIGHPVLPSGMGGRLVPVAVRVARGSVLAVLRDSFLIDYGASNFFPGKQLLVEMFFQLLVLLFLWFLH